MASLLRLTKKKLECISSTLLRLSHANMLIESLGKKNMALKIEIAKLKKQQRQVDSSINQKSKIFYSDLQKMHEKHTDLQNQLKSLRDENMIYKKRSFDRMDADESPTISWSVYGKCYKRLGTALDDITSNSQENVDIVLIPPDVDIQTDEEEIDEDECHVSHFPTEVPGEVEVHYDSADDDIPLSEIVAQPGQSSLNSRNEMNRKGHEPIWTEEMINLEMTETHGYCDRLNELKGSVRNETPVETFERLFDGDILEHIAGQSMLYAAQKEDHTFSVTKDDIKVFIGILIFSGYHRLPRERSFWSLDEDLSVPCISNAMSRNRYYEIKKYLHFADNSNLNENDKMYKVRPLITMLNKNFQQWGIFHPHLCIDEAMVKYFGHHSAKQFVKGKPVRFGYKEWLLCSSTGYCYNFDVYCGAKPSEQKRATLPLGSRVVLELLECVAQPSDHTVFFNNYFTSHSLLKTLREMGFRATGTIKENRTSNCPLPSKDDINKEEQGYFRFMFDKTNSLLFVKWKDNDVITLATNYDGIEPQTRVKRWSPAKKEKIEVLQPQLLSKYKSSIGGVDLVDQAVNNYRITIQGKKWWWPIFTHMINVTLVNAWRIHILDSDNSVDLLTFIRSITRHYLRCFIDATNSKARPSASVCSSIVQNKGGHYPGKTEKQLRCRQCHLKSRWKCIKCNITLCLARDCFIEFHNNH